MSRERASLNKVILVGRLGRDPEIRYVPSREGERAVARFSIATSEIYIGKDGDRKELTEWHSVYVWGKLANFVKDYLKKGRQVLVEGKLRTRKWETEGQKRSKTEIEASKIILLDRKADIEGPASDMEYSGGESSPSGIEEEPPF